MQSKQLEIGDHVFVEYRWFTHHGIYCGDEKVIHNSKQAGKVTETSLAKFTDGRPIRVQQAVFRDAPEVIVRRARSQLGKRAYNLFFDNCEHFANWCQTGSSKSPQVRKWVASGVGMTGVGSGARAGRSGVSAAVRELTKADKPSLIPGATSLASLGGVAGFALGLPLGLMMGSVLAGKIILLLEGK